MSRSTTISAAWLCLVVAACGGQDKHQADYPAQRSDGYQQGQPHPPAETPPNYGQPGYPQPGYPPPPPPPAPAHPPAPSPKTLEWQLPERVLTTVAAAQSALEEDEVLLIAVIDQHAIMLAQGHNTCDRVCKALGSMRRSVSAICELAGEDDDRCGRARTRLEGAESRVSNAGCGCEAP